MTVRRIAGVGAALGLVLAFGIVACDRGGSNAPARDHSAEDGGSNGSSSHRDGYSEGHSRYVDGERARTPIPLIDGKPMWSDNRQHSAEENASYHFQHDGPDFSASDEKDYVSKAHRFIEHPPTHVQTALRSNGDKLMYDPDSNTFAVARKDGAPRTMFKPHAGEAYWKEQQAKIASGDSYGGSRRSYRAPDAKSFGKSEGGDSGDT